MQGGSGGSSRDGIPAPIAVKQTITYNIKGEKMSAVPEQYISLEEYFRMEETSEIKHEYYQGAVFAMAGASIAHNQIVAAVGGSLDRQHKMPPSRGASSYTTGVRD